MNRSLHLVGRLLTLLGWLSITVAVVLLAALAYLHSRSADPYIVRSGSMEPTFSAGDLTVARRVPADDIQAGDVITFYQPRIDSIVTHRVMQRSTGEELSWLTKGDANDAADIEPVRAQDLRGRYWFSVRGAGYAAIVLTSTTGRIAIVAIPAFLLLLGMALSTPRAARATRVPDTEPARAAQ